MIYIQTYVQKKALYIRVSRITKVLGFHYMPISMHRHAPGGSSYICVMFLLSDGLSKNVARLLRENCILKNYQI